VSTSRNNRGRRDIASHLGLLDQAVGDPTMVVARGRSKRAAPKSRRRKLPSDRTIAGAFAARIFKWVYRVVAAFALVSVTLVVIYRYVDPPVTPLMLIRPLERLGEGDLTGVSKQWIDIDRIDPDVARSVIAAEDARFFEHGGIDWKAVEEAQKRNDRYDGRKVYGGSTISMQTAKNVFLWQGRNYLRKGMEAYFTYLIELIWGKKRILEVYLNVIEWGDGIYGVEAASQKYFGRSSTTLTPRQAALLAALLPNPRHYSPQQPDAYVERRARRIQAGARVVSLDAMR
jgi:monofunctional biosynthetic peptidoglycan transglycosylase